MKKTRANAPFPPQSEQPRHCENPGCSGEGMYRAPVAPDRLREYQWFCLDHVKEYNQKWNYFSDKDEDDIETFIKESVTGHRPTWTRESHLNGYNYSDKLQEELRRFMGGTWHHYTAANTKPIGTKERKALATLEIETPGDLQAVKTKYRALVKKIHPDLHRGDKTYEDKFKQVTAAYTYLVELYKSAD